MTFREELNGMRRISEISLATALVITPLSIIFSLITGSVTLLIYFIWAAAGIAVKVFALISIRIMQKENLFMFPYGTGKLENFSSFFFGCSIVPVGIYFLIDSSLDLFHPLPAVTYLLCQIPVVLSFLFTLALLWYAGRLISQDENSSPLLKAYYLNFRISLASDGFLFIGLLAGYLLSAAGLTSFSLRVDPILSIILSLYMIRVGLPLIIDNFRSLIDLPLPEKEMLNILKVITEFNKDYSGLGLIFSRSSGKHRIVEIELYFPASLSLQTVRVIEAKMAASLVKLVPNLSFRLLPRIMEEKSRDQL
ncbi:MAG: cation transporter [Bacteroidota bacterium]